MKYNQKNLDEFYSMMFATKSDGSPNPNPNNQKFYSIISQLNGVVISKSESIAGLNDPANSLQRVSL